MYIDSGYQEGSTPKFQKDKQHSLDLRISILNWLQKKLHFAHKAHLFESTN